MPILFTKIQFHDHPAAFTVAEFFLAVAAEFSFRFRYIAVQRFLQFLRDAAPWNDIAHARIPPHPRCRAVHCPHRTKSGSPETHPQTVPPDTLPFAVCAPSEAHPALDSGHSQAVWIYTAGYAVSAPPLHCHSVSLPGAPHLHEWCKSVFALQHAGFPVSAAVLLPIVVRTFDVLLWLLAVAQHASAWVLA